MHHNHLIHEKSPYLLQHAHNPVNWYPWEEAAFAAAKAENKPIFLSIGYSTCHWCHVMEKESFEDGEVAALLNANFICIKVDREERPDIDSVYMSVCQAMTGAGGWPMTIFITPDKKPFYAGTYFPKHSLYGIIGLMELLTEICHFWKTDQRGLLKTSEEITNSIARQIQLPAAAPSTELLHDGRKLLEKNFDHEYGGFFAAPKFPVPHNLLFLMKYYDICGEESVLHMAETTLIQMARGGIFDHIGGGFSRYSTDRKWLIPHFEKMLYDNALLSLAYTEGFRLTADIFYKSVACRTLDYILRELTHSQGGFYCGQDADSDGIEGKYYVFTPDEVYSVLGLPNGRTYCKFYDITEKGNFEGKNILNLLENKAYFDKNMEEMTDMSEILYRYRLHRTKLHLDDKILTSWNALAIAALAQASRIFQEPRYLQCAQRAAAFIRKNLTDKSGRLYVRWRDGEAVNPGGLDDYAFMVWGLLELYAADYEILHLKWALQLTETMIELFWDQEKGGFYLYASDAEQLISRPKELYDGAIPSGNSAASLVLNRLSGLTGNRKLQQTAQIQAAFIAGSIAELPASHCFSLYATIELLYPACHLVCALPHTVLPEGLQNLSCRYPVTLLVKTPQSAEVLAALAPFTADMQIPAAGIRYYLCKSGTCFAPTESLETVIRNLEK